MVRINTNLNEIEVNGRTINYTNCKINNLNEDGCFICIYNGLERIVIRVYFNDLMVNNSLVDYYIVGNLFEIEIEE